MKKCFLIIVLSFGFCSYSQELDSLAKILDARLASGEDSIQMVFSIPTRSEWNSRVYYISMDKLGKWFGIYSEGKTKKQLFRITTFYRLEPKNSWENFVLRIYEYHVDSLCSQGATKRSYHDAHPALVIYRTKILEQRTKGANGEWIWNKTMCDKEVKRIQKLVKRAFKKKIIL